VEARLGLTGGSDLDYRIGHDVMDGSSHERDRTIRVKPADVREHSLHAIHQSTLKGQVS
jgi:hypothetical protein